MSEVWRPESGVEVQNSKIETRDPAASLVDSEFRSSSLEPRTPDGGIRTLIIGYGNPLRSDDGFGWYASHLLGQLLAGQDIEVLTCPQLTPEIAEQLSRCESAVFIDADSKGEPGEVHRYDLEPGDTSAQSFTHNCTPSGLLASAEELYGHRPQAVAITVSAQSFDFGDELSPVVAAAIPGVLEQVCEFVGVTLANIPKDDSTAAFPKLVASSLLGRLPKACRDM